MRASELRKKDESALREELQGLLREQFNLRMQSGTGQLAKPDQIGKVRRDIARVRTVLNEMNEAGNA